MVCWNKGLEICILYNKREVYYNLITDAKYVFYDRIQEMKCSSCLT